MKEFELEARIRNNRLKQRRLELGMNQAQFAAATGLHPTTYGALESLRKSPLRSDGEWSSVALRLAEFHGVPVEDLFPPAVVAVRQPVTTRRVDAADVWPLLSEHQTLSLEPPDRLLEIADAARGVESEIRKLPPKEQMSVRRRFGIGVEPDATRARTAKRLGVCDERMRQIELNALYKLERLTKHKQWRTGHPTWMLQEP